MSEHHLQKWRKDPLWRLSECQGVISERDLEKEGIKLEYLKIIRKEKNLS